MKCLSQILTITMLFLGGAFGHLLPAQDSLSCQDLLEKAAQQTNPSEAIRLANIALQTCESSQQTEQVVTALHFIAQQYQQKEDIPTALRYYLQALKIREDLLPISEELPLLTLEIAQLYEDWAVYPKAFYYYQKSDRFSSEAAYLPALEGMARSKQKNGELTEALNYYQSIRAHQREVGNVRQEVATLREMINIYREAKAWEESLRANEAVYRLNAVLQDTAEMIVSLNNAGVLYRQSGNLQEALTHFLKAADLEKSHLTGQEANPVTLINIGILYQNLGDYANSLRYLSTARLSLLREATLDPDMLANVHNLIAIVYLTLHDYKQAFEYNRQALKYAVPLSDQSIAQLCYKTRSSIFEQVNDYEEALNFYQKYVALKDTFTTQEMWQREQQLQRQFSAEQTEKEMSLLLIDREVEELKLRQQELETEQLRNEQALQKSVLQQERLEREKAEQALLYAQEELDRRKAEQNLLLTRQQLQTEQKDRQIALLEKEQSEQMLSLTQQRLATEQKERENAQQERENLRLDLELQEKDFQLQNQREKLIRNTVLGILFTSIIVLLLIYRNNQLRRRAHQKLAVQKQELQTALDHLKLTQSQLVQAEKMASLGALTAGIAHEINNPLNFVTSNTHALKMDLEEIAELMKEVHRLKENATPQEIQAIIDKSKTLDTQFLMEETQQLVDSIARGAERTSNIVAGLRVFSRKSINDDFALADLHEGLESTLTILNSRIKSRITIHRNYGDLPLVNCQFDRLNQVFMNILSNAIQAIDDTGDIFITTKAINEEVMISILDTGHGMNEEVRQRILEPFFTTKEVGEGTGLGLSISFGIIEAHRGRLEVHSKPGKGSEFVVYLPVNIT